MVSDVYVDLVDLWSRNLIFTQSIILGLQIVCTNYVSLRRGGGAVDTVVSCSTFIISEDINLHCNAADSFFSIIVPV